MVKLKDSHFPKILQNHNYLFYNATFFYRTNALAKILKLRWFFMVSEKKKIYLENRNSSGNLIFFDGSIVYGFDTIDSDNLLNLDPLCGHSALFVNLYEKL